MKPEKKALEYLKSKGFDFDEDKESLQDIKYAFGEDYKNDFFQCLQRLSKRGWCFYNINDINKLEKARRIHRNQRRIEYRKINKEI